MNKVELKSAVAEKLGVTGAEAERTIATVIDTIIEGAKADGECVVPALGKLNLVDVPERSGTAMGVKWVKKAHKVLKLKLNKAGKDQTGA